MAPESLPKVSILLPNHNKGRYLAEAIGSVLAQDPGIHGHLKEHLLQIAYYRLLVQFADRPWLGRKSAREPLFEEQYRNSKGSGN